MHPWNHTLGLFLVTAVTAVGLPAGSEATDQVPVSTRSSSAAQPGRDARGAEGRNCERRLDQAIRAYLSTTGARDAPAYIGLLHRDYTVVLPGGTTITGKAAGSAFINRFFARTDWTQTFRVVSTHVERCSTATTLFDSTYTDNDGPVHLVIGLTWVWQHGTWLVLLDQNTVVDS